MIDLFKKVFGEEIKEAYKVVAEYEAFVGAQKIKIKLMSDLNNKYAYILSHHYHGSKQASPYASSNIVNFANMENALNGARTEIFAFYDPSDEKAVWEKDEDF